MLEIRRVVAELLSKYEITPGPSHDQHQFLDAKEDTFTTVPGALPLVFKRRV
jgi:hypothetical protein